MGRAFTVKNLVTKKFNTMPFENEWLESFGCPERACHWTIWGQSGSGKTTFLLQLAKYLSNFDRVIYNSKEEGLSESLKIAVNRVDLNDIPSGRILFTDESLPEQTKRLERKKSQNIIINDSIQEMNFNKTEYLDFKDKFANKLFIWVSQATPNGKHPSNNLGQFIRHASPVKVNISGYVAFITSRYEGFKPFVIWPDGAKEYWGLDYTELKNAKQ